MIKVVSADKQIAADSPQLIADFKFASLGKFTFTHFRKHAKHLPDLHINQLRFYALVLISKKIISLDTFALLTRNHPRSFLESIFDENICYAMYKQWISFETLTTMLTAHDKPENDSVDALFAGQAIRDELVARFKSLVTYATELEDNGICIDKDFVAVFLNKSMQQSELDNYFQVYLQSPKGLNGHCL